AIEESESGTALRRGNNFGQHRLQERILGAHSNSPQDRAAQDQPELSKKNERSENSSGQEGTCRDRKADSIIKPPQEKIGQCPGSHCDGIEERNLRVRDADGLLRAKRNQGNI